MYRYDTIFMFNVCMIVPTPDDDASIVKEVIYESDVKTMMDSSFVYKEALGACCRIKFGKNIIVSNIIIYF